MKLHLRPILTAALLAGRAHAGEHFATALPGGTSCTSRVARPFGSLPGETPHGWGGLDVAPNDFRGNSINATQSRLKGAPGDSDALGGLSLTWAELNAPVPPIITIGGKGRQPKGADHGHSANRKAPDVAGRAVRRLK